MSDLILIKKTDKEPKTDPERGAGSWSDTIFSTDGISFSVWLGLLSSVIWRWTRVTGPHSFISFYLVFGCASCKRSSPHPLLHTVSPSVCLCSQRVMCWYLPLSLPVGSGYTSHGHISGNKGTCDSTGRTHTHCKHTSVMSVHVQILLYIALTLTFSTLKECMRG